MLNTGHVHPRVTAAVRRQLEFFSHTCYRVVPYETYVSVAENLNQVAPVCLPAIFSSSGAEAVEKVVRAAMGRSAIIAFSGAFHEVRLHPLTRRRGAMKLGMKRESPSNLSRSMSSANAALSCLNATVNSHGAASAIAFCRVRG